MAKKFKNIGIPALEGTAIRKSPAQAVGELQKMVASLNDQQKESKKDLIKYLCETILDSFDNMFTNASSNNKNSDPSRIFAVQYNWVKELLASVA